jgi:hypothetical protein
VSVFPMPVVKVCLLSLFVIYFNEVHGTRTLPPTLIDLVAASEHVGLATIRKAEDYYVTDEQGDVWCGVIYEAKWVDSLTGDSGRVEFSSKQVLEVRGLYLLYLAKSSLPRKLLSTNSRSEAERTRRLKREKLCNRTEQLPRTVYKAAGFFDETHLAEDYKTGTWLEFPRFSDNALTEIVIMPTELSISGEVIPRDRFLNEYYDEYKHGVIRTAGYQLIIFRAVDWTEYCSALIEAVELKADSRLPTSRTPPTFCEPKSPWLPASR